MSKLLCEILSYERENLLTLQDFWRFLDRRTYEPLPHLQITSPILPEKFESHFPHHCFFFHSPQQPPASFGELIAPISNKSTKQPIAIPHLNLLYFSSVFYPSISFLSIEGIQNTSFYLSATVCTNVGKIKCLFSSQCLSHLKILCSVPQWCEHRNLLLSSLLADKGPESTSPYYSVQADC